jgi:hypothetical protein
MKPPATFFIFQDVSASHKQNRKLTLASKSVPSIFMTSYKEDLTKVTGVQNKTACRPVIYV